MEESGGNGMDLLGCPRVGVQAQYRGTFRSHWEARNGIPVRVAPWRQAIIAVPLFIGVLLSYRFGWIIALELWGAATLLAVWVLLSAHERWFPIMPPTTTLGSEPCFRG